MYEGEIFPFIFYKGKKVSPKNKNIILKLFVK